MEKEDSFKPVSKMSDQTLAAICMNINIMFQIVYQAIAKYSVAELAVDPIDLCFTRTLVLMIVAYMVARKNGKRVLADIEPEDRNAVTLRGAIGTVSYGSMVYAVSILPMVVSLILINTVPFWTAIFGFYVNKENMSLSELVCMAGCFTGVVVLVVAGNGAKNTDAKQVGFKEDANFMLGVFCALLCSMTMAVVVVTTRKLRKIHYSIMLFNYGLIATVLYGTCAILMWLADPNAKAWPSIFYYGRQQWINLAVIAVFNTTAQYFATQAFQRGKSSFVTIVGEVNTVYAFLFDLFIFHVDFQPLQIVGALTVVTFTLALICQKNK